MNLFCNTPILIRIINNYYFILTIINNLYIIPRDELEYNSVYILVFQMLYTVCTQGVQLLYTHVKTLFSSAVLHE